MGGLSPDLRDERHDRLDQQVDGSRLSQPVGKAAGRQARLEPRQEHGGSEEALLDEVAHRGADPVAVVGKDGGVRDRQAERVAKQGGDREPVGKAADDPRFGGGADERCCEVVSTENAGRDKDEHHRAEKRGRKRAVTPQRCDPLRLGR